jgi:hypothetical protein
MPDYTSILNQILLCCQQNPTIINNNTNNQIQPVKKALTFNSIINQGKCDPKTGQYKPDGPYTDTTLESVFTDLSTQIKDVHVDLCNIDGSSSFIIPDGKSTVYQYGTYLVFRWGLQDDPYNPKYYSLTQLPSPIPAIFNVTSDTAKAIWQQYFDSLTIVRGNQPAALYGQGYTYPIYRSYFQDEDEAKRVLNIIATFTSIPKATKNTIGFNSYINSDTAITNAGKTFIPVGVTVVEKIARNSDAKGKIFYLSRKILH